MEDFDIYFKLAAVLSVVFVSLLGSFLPLRLSNVSQEYQSTVMELSKYFTAGVFLGVGLLHMLPESAKELHKAGVGFWSGKEFPVAYAVCAAGILIVWFVERHSSRGPGEKERLVAVAAGARQHGGASICYVKVHPVSSYGPVARHWIKNGPLEAPSGLLGQADISKLEPLLNSAQSAGQVQIFDDRASGEIKDDVQSGSLIVDLQGPDKFEEEGGPIFPLTSCQEDQQLSNGHTSRVSSAWEARDQQEGARVGQHMHSFSSHALGCQHKPHTHVTRGGGQLPVQRQTVGREQGSEVLQATSSHSLDKWLGLDQSASDETCANLHAHEHDSQHHHLVLGGEASMAYILAGLFSLHSFVVGAALGAESHFNSAVSLLIAVLAHKGAEAFAVGVQFVKEKVDMRKTILVVLIYCSMTPLGILVGMAELVVKGSAGIIAANLTQAFGAGTILYITMMQLTHSSGAECNRWLQLSLLLLGLSIMATVALYS
eukprot:SM000001S04682  [mRNA]  locus=s1:1637387:1639671:- [translate_table: standard]